MKFQRVFVAVGVVGLGWAGGREARADEGAPPVREVAAAQAGDVRAAPPPATAVNGDPRARWYGGRLLLADGISTGLILTAFAGSAPTAALGLGGYVLAPPILHASRGHWGKAAASLGLRVGAPFVSGMIALYATTGRFTFGSGEMSGLAAIPFMLGATVGVTAAMAIDAGALAFDPPNEFEGDAEARAERARADARTRAARASRVTFDVGVAPTKGGGNVSVFGTW